MSRMMGWANLAVLALVGASAGNGARAVMLEQEERRAPGVVRPASEEGGAVRTTASEVVGGVAPKSQAVVVLVRHGEQQQHTTGLSADGVRRAKYLARCASGTAATPALPFGPPQVIAASTIVPGRSTRPHDTAAPLASALGLSVDTSIPSSAHKRFASFVHAHLAPNATVFAAWQHNEIPSLVKHLDMPNYHAFKSWPKKCNAAAWKEPKYIRHAKGSKCYDAIWQMRFEEQSPGKWLPLGVSLFHEGFGGSASSPCAQGFALPQPKEEEEHAVNKGGALSGTPRSATSEHKSTESDMSLDLDTTLLTVACLVMALAGAAVLSVRRQNGREAERRVQLDSLMMRLNTGAVEDGGGVGGGCEEFKLEYQFQHLSQIPQYS